MSKPRLLDLYCGGGGTGAGYAQAGFDVTGVDLDQHDEYPFEFVRGDAIAFLLKHGGDFDAIHASPPCQKYTTLAALHRDREYPDLVAPTREGLIASGRPYIIENVPGAPLIEPIALCGLMFGLRLFRHRHFETSFPIEAPAHVSHKGWTNTPFKNGRSGSNREPEQPHHVWQLAGHMGGAARAAVELGMPWMVGHPHSLTESVPPAYAKYVGDVLMKQMEVVLSA